MLLDYFHILLKHVSWLCSSNAMYVSKLLASMSLVCLSKVQKKKFFFLLVLNLSSLVSFISTSLCLMGNRMVLKSKNNFWPSKIYVSQFACLQNQKYESWNINFWKLKVWHWENLTFFEISNFTKGITDLVLSENLLKN